MVYQSPAQTYFNQKDIIVWIGLKQTDHFGSFWIILVESHDPQEVCRDGTPMDKNHWMGISHCHILPSSPAKASWIIPFRGCGFSTLWFYQTWLAGKSPHWMEVLIGNHLFLWSILHRHICHVWLPEGKSHQILWHHHFPMVFLWFSYGVPMVFPG